MIPETPSALSVLNTKIIGFIENWLGNFKGPNSNQLTLSPNENITSIDLFKDDKDNDAKLFSMCGDCAHKNTCRINKSSPLCKYVKTLKNYNKNKKSIVIVDDNEGVISFILDDLEYLKHEYGLKLDNYNILTFGSQYGVFKLQATLQAYDITDIEFGIFDITLGGGLFDPLKGNVVLDGVDAFKLCYEQSIISDIDFKFLFFTGNKLNPYIKKNEETIKKFNRITQGLDIGDYILYKTSKTFKDRRAFFKNFFNSIGFYEVKKTQEDGVN